MDPLCLLMLSAMNCIGCTVVLAVNGISDKFRQKCSLYQEGYLVHGDKQGCEGMACKGIGEKDFSQALR